MFDRIRRDISARLKVAKAVPVQSWQSVKAPQPMPELLNYSLTYSLPTESLQFYRDQIQPNLPWADDHFEQERSSGVPLNPGTTYKYWVSGASADTHRREQGQFDHSYAERLWPKFAGITPDGTLPPKLRAQEPHSGIRFEYGDLDDLIKVLGADPLTRQGYVPLWFPEDLSAAAQSKRVPCTLGYHFIVRNNELHTIYYLRSCDFVRHFCDDAYLAIRLAHWVLGELRRRYPYTPPDDLESQLTKMGCLPDQGGWEPTPCYNFDWGSVTLGTLTMHITSLHCFESDRSRL